MSWPATPAAPPTAKAKSELLPDLRMKVWTIGTQMPRFPAVVVVIYMHTMHAWLTVQMLWHMHGRTLQVVHMLIVCMGRSGSRQPALLRKLPLRLQLRKQKRIAHQLPAREHNQRQRQLITIP